MRKLCLSAAVALLAFASNAQTVNDIPLKDINVTHCQIVGTSKMFSNKVNVDIDFGQENKYFSSDKDTKIKGADGKNITFNSMVDALNFMVENGFEFVQAYAFSTGGSGNVYHYLLKKKK